ncbi:ribonuclease H-like domain-containing protein [Tanacetum coccineum]
MFLCQKKYAAEVLERAGMRNCHSCRTIVIESKLGADSTPGSDPTLYRSLDVALQYLTFTRPDVSYAVQQVCLYMHDPREPHLAVLERILRCPTTRHSTSGYYVFLGNNLLSGHLKDSAPCLKLVSRLSIVVLPMQWLRRPGCGIFFESFTLLYILPLLFIVIMERVATGRVYIFHVPSRYQYADIFAKGLPYTLFDEFQTSLSILRHPAPTVGSVSGLDCLYWTKPV